MPRPTFLPNSAMPYHVYARCLNKDWFEIPLEEVWKIMSHHLHFSSKAFDVRIHSFVLMQNHFHLLTSTPQANLSKAMGFFMRSTSDSIAEITGRINPMWGTRYNRSLIETFHYFMNVYKYVYRNPVKSGVSNCVEEYKFSTLSGLLGFEHLMIPLEEDTLLFDDVERTMKWLNTEPDEFNWLSMKKGLKRQVFNPGYAPNRKNKSMLETSLL